MKAKIGKLGWKEKFGAFLLEAQFGDLSSETSLWKAQFGNLSLESSVGKLSLESLVWRAQFVGLESLVWKAEFGSGG